MLGLAFAIIGEPSPVILSFQYLLSMHARLPGKLGDECV